MSAVIAWLDRNQWACWLGLVAGILTIALLDVPA